MSDEIIICGVCQNDYPQSEFVLAANGREVCNGCADSQGGANPVVEKINQQIAADMAEVDKLLAETQNVSTDGNGNESTDTTNAPAKDNAGGAGNESGANAGAESNA